MLFLCMAFHKNYGFMLELYKWFTLKWSTFKNLDCVYNCLAGCRMHEHES